MITQEEMRCLEAMQSGGSFAFALSRAYLHADVTNRAKLRSAFADVFTRYGLPSVGRAEPMTLDDMLIVVRGWAFDASNEVSSYAFHGAVDFIRWYYSQPEGGACHE